MNSRNQGKNAKNLLSNLDGPKRPEHKIVLVVKMAQPKINNQFEIKLVKSFKKHVANVLN